MSTITNSVCTSIAPLTLAAVGQVVLHSSGAAGVGNVSVESGWEMQIDARNSLSIDCSDGPILIGTDAINNEVAIGTAGDRTVSIGSLTGSSGVWIYLGSNGLNIPTFTTTGALVSTSAGIITDANASTSGFVLVSNGNSVPPSFQSASASGAVLTLTGNSGGAISPTSGNINITGTGSITVAGAGSTLTPQLTGLTNHSLLVGAGTATITNLGVATNGQLPIGSTGANPVLAAITQGTNITITNGAGSITLDVATAAGLSLAAFGSSPNANGLTLSAGVLNMQPASSTQPGGVSTTTQTMAGAKTFTSTVASGVAGSSIGGFLLSGNTSGTISILPQAAAGTFNYNLPITAGTSTDVLTSGGGGATAMTWTAATATPTASAIGKWDANVNFSANNLIRGYATTVTAAGTTTLTVASAQQQYFTGTTTQTVTMPVTSTLVLGQMFQIVNNSTGVVTVNSSGANLIQSMAAGSVLSATVILTSGTTAASWSIQYDFGQSGNVVGPGASTDLGIASWNGTTGILLRSSSACTLATNGNISISGAINGGNRIFTNTNTSATASSNSINRNIATAGDVVFNVIASGTNGFGWGLDTTSALNLKECTGTGTTVLPSTATTLRNMTSTGIQTLPLQPAYQAYLGTNVTNATGDGTAFQLGTTTALTENFDRGTNFNTNGTFTAPAAGIYNFSATVAISNLLVGHVTATVSMTISGNSYVVATLNPYVAQAGTGVVTMSGSALISMATNDTAVAIITVTGSTKTVTVNSGIGVTYFYGYLEC